MMLTLAQQMTRIGRHFGDRPAVRDGTSITTWAEVAERVAVAAGLLAGLDLATGARVGIYSRNSARFDELKWGAFRAGLVGVPINWRLAPAEILARFETVFEAGPAGIARPISLPALTGSRPESQTSVPTAAAVEDGD